MPSPKQKTIDLKTGAPAGWQLIGFSGVKSDGVNPFRTPQLSSEIKFDTAGSRYIRFQYQLYSPDQAVKAHVTLDDQDLGYFDFPAGQFKTVYPAALVKAGKHSLRFKQSCPLACPINQYHAEVKLITLPDVRINLGLQAQRWSPDALDSTFSVNGFSGLQFDGVNYFRELNTLDSALFSLPFGYLATNFHTQTISNNGSYRLSWASADGNVFRARLSLQKAYLPKGHFVDQDLPLIQKEGLSQLRVQTICEGGGSSCLPIRFYWTELTTLPSSRGLITLTPPKLLAFSLLFLVLLGIFALLLRPLNAKH
ncbi:hypothetical protein EHF33_04335 [Deinococcus psychrotolerans]|uniref:Uncharacterized protein n=1 Tax=Deinococcus psychrotolerans TaxID=2489213 RepID=A0A3G8YAW7_9DEIO|nr:hypothetical protein [Deinococcus psychrotolerans]AZI42070.1 hypothetical protein EHF33_04335 [Deinococcus psychrotolerans]